MLGIDDDIVVWGPRGARRATSWPAFAAAAERVASLLAHRAFDAFFARTVGRTRRAAAPSPTPTPMLGR